MLFSTGIERALRVALEAHADQTRKGAARLPYVSHPVHVALILAQLGLDEVAVQAALLHDVVEDCDGWDDPRVRSNFGGAVADIVAALTEDKSRTWDERKRHAIEHVAQMSTEAAHVKAADKLHNLSCLLEELQNASDADEVWAHFRGGREKTLRMARELIEALEPRVLATLGQSLRSVLKALEEQTNAD
ncbi:MAG: (p)ppGpp synthase/HD superfamily hydrolase [Chlamydiales bacterium]|jgi:(p)ppGpp synthase/HD superfamily hydrolase